MSALATDYAVQPERQSAPDPIRTWDPVTFRMSEPPAPRGITERRTEAISWRGETGPLPDPAQWGAAVVRTAVECLLGLRPVQQLTRWLDEPVYAALSRRAGLAVRVLGVARGRQARIRTSHAQRIDELTAEVVVTLHDGKRCRAAALRLECYHGRWLVTALEIG